MSISLCFTQVEEQTCRISGLKSVAMASARSTQTTACSHDKSIIPTAPYYYLVNLAYSRSHMPVALPADLQGGVHELDTFIWSIFHRIRTYTASTTLAYMTCRADSTTTHTHENSKTLLLLCIIFFLYKIII